MIQTAAPSVSSSISLAAAIQGAPADDAAASGGFAALLDSKVAPDAEGAVDPLAALQAALGLQIRQATGSPAGKKLPGEVADAAAALADAAAKIGDGTGEDGEAALDATLALPTGDIILPGLVVPVAIQLPQTPATVTPTVSSATSGNALGQGTAAQAIRTLPTTSQPAIAATLAMQTQATKAADQSAGQPQTAPTVTLVPAAAAALQADPALAKMAAEATAQPAITTTAAALTPAAPTVSTAAALAAQVNGPVNGQATAPDSTSKKAEGPRTDSPTSAKAAAGEQPSTLATLTTSQQAQTQAQATTEPAAAKADTTSPAPKPTTAEVTVESALQGEGSKKADARTAAAGDIEAPTTTPAAATPPTVLAAQDGQSLSQTVASVNAAPTTTAVQSGHDFATLVDRLVEAREAANPNTVHASLKHAEFGQVSLRIDQDQKGLAVTMTSADPDFAGAVQATAASAQAQTSSDDRQNQQRQDTQRQDTGSQLQQQGASLAGQSHSQSQAFGQGERDDRSGSSQGETRGARANEKSTIIEDTADTRSGIYA